jgi:DNA-directed RNA polymerase specialized sigma24 family protein
MRAALSSELDEAQDLRQRFAHFRQRWETQVSAIIRRGRLEDPEASEAEVWAKAWAAFPRMARREAEQRARLTRGHNWGGWISQIARRVVIDEKRRAAVIRRLYGVRARRRVDVHEDDTGDHPDGECWREPYGWGDGLPLDVDEIADAGAGDPYASAEAAARGAVVRAGVDALAPIEWAALRGWLFGTRDRDTAAAMGISLEGVKRARRRALVRLRAAARANGWEVAPDRVERGRPGKVVRSRRQAAARRAPQA